jgi:hypothetical protein
MAIRKILREPLVHFLFLGAMLFGIFALTGKGSGERSGRIKITPGLLENLKLSFARQEGHPPDERETQGAIDAYVREEILTREARVLGLDRDDPVVRYRLVQRIDFFNADSVAAPTPTDADLETFLKNNPDRFKNAEGQVPSLAEAHAAVQRAWVEARRKEAMDAAYRRLREHYTVVVEKSAAPAKQ